MQRILPRGEIEGLDHTAIPRWRLPDHATIFRDRAARLRELAPGHAIEAYLHLMADLAQAQHQVLATLTLPAVPQPRLAAAQAHGMPPLSMADWPRDPVWRKVLDQLLQTLLAQPGMAPQACAALQALAEQAHEQPDALEAAADRLLAESPVGLDPAAAPFVMAALQVYWTRMACDFDAHDLPVVTPSGVCPLCGSLPVSSVVRVGGAADGCRYLCCGLCATEWHMVRVTCSHCQSTEGIAYHAIESGPQGIKAESCDQCHVYRKIFYQEHQLAADPVADDLASLPLDILMGEQGFERASGNPLLWQGDTEPA